MLEHEATGCAPDEISGSDGGLTSHRIVCVQCEHVITTTKARTEVAKRHHHTCVNRSGCIYRIACYGRANGAVGHGDWSDDYSWFKDYWWQIALCRGCACHLGWAFSGKHQDDFWGLIRERVREASV